MIVEGLVTTADAEGRPNLAPMGPLVAGAPPWPQLTLRPFAGSRTHANLLARGEGVFHVTDDVLLLARATLGNPPAATMAVPGLVTPRLADCCHWYAFRVVGGDRHAERATLEAEVVAAGEVRPFFGLSRAKAAIVELAVLASRVHLLEPDFLRAEADRLKVPVDKTGGPDEQAAFALLRERLPP